MQNILRKRSCVSKRRKGNDMLEILKFIFSDFWHWIGTVVLVAVLASARLFDVYVGNKNDKKD